MQNTSNYNLNLVEGTDLVNPPIQFNPNFQTIDTAMFANKEKTVGVASEVVTGTAHAIVRNNPDSDVFRFTSTGAWTTGDTMTVDGVSVTVHLTDGTAPLTGAYIIGSEVLAVINGTLVTLIISSAAIDPGVTSFNSRTGAVSPTASDYDASMIDYDNTVSGLTATDAQSAIDEVVSMIPSGGGSDDYSTTEHVVGTWLNGLTPVYEKTVYCGAMPNNTTKNVAHGVTDLDKWISIEGVAQGRGYCMPLPYVESVTANMMGVYIYTDNIVLKTASDYHEWDAYITLRYTKTI